MTLTPAKAVLLIVLVGWIAYANSLTKAFLLDDDVWILRNDTLPSWSQNLQASSTRPVVAITLTANWKLGGLHPVGYHLFNVMVHILAAILFFDTVRRTMLLPRFAGRYDAAALPIAFAAALLWVAHPMNTHAVTYVIQRCESMMGLFYVGSLYCLLRGSQSKWAGPWYAASVASAWLGMGCKEILVTAPIVLVIFDRVFLADSWKEIAVRRGLLYVGLCLVPTPAIVRHINALIAPPATGLSIGYDLPEVSGFGYFYTQAGVILYYLRLAVWPNALCFDYRDWPFTQTFRDFLPTGIPVGLAVLASAYGVWRRHWLGFLGAWFFLILAPTSSILPLLDAVNEYRMYLPLMAVTTLAAASGYWLLSRWRAPDWAAPVALTALVVPLVFATNQRNEDYANSLTMYEDVLAKRPNNIRIYSQIGLSYELESKWKEAIEAYEKTLQHSPNNFYALYSLGHLNYRDGDRQKGLHYLERAIKRYNSSVELTTIYGLLLSLEGQPEKSLPYFDLALRNASNKALPHYLKAAVLMTMGRNDEAKKAYDHALQRFPEWPKRLHGLAQSLLRGRCGDSEGVRREALFFAKTATEAMPTKTADAFETLADAYVWAGRPADAVAPLREAIDLAETEDERTRLQEKLGRLPMK